MDRINGLSDDLLIKILSFLPTKFVVSTSILSRRWECLWKWLPKLEFCGRLSTESEYQKLRCFLDKNLPLHRAPVIESFRLTSLDTRAPERFRLRSLDKRFKPEDINPWVVIAISRYLCELEISYSASFLNKSILPSSLYTCKSLVTLKHQGDFLLDVPSMVGLSSLKFLQLQRLRLVDGESLRRFLSICPVLENIMLEFYRPYVNLGMITVVVPSLESLSLKIPCNCHIDGIVIDTPSLRYLKFEHYNKSSHSWFVKNMPKLREAYLDVSFHGVSSLIESITSVKHLTLSSKVHVYGGDLVFNQLEHLKLCVGAHYAWNLLVRLLEDSPNLRVLDLFKMDSRNGRMGCWNQPSTVPECIMSSLETFEWSGYLGTRQERDLAVYILRNACRLKTATISFDDRIVGTKPEMIKELSLSSSRASITCQLVFDQGF